MVYPAMLKMSYVGIMFWASCFECKIGVHGQNDKKQTMLFAEKNKIQLVDRTSLIFDKNKKLD